MSAEVLQQEKLMSVIHPKMTEIFSDDDFNIRGHIRPTDIVELAKNIDSNGLLQPITVQPYNNKLHPEFKYKVVAGHRRHAAYSLLKRETIPAVVRENLSELDALTFNFVENINRKDLNILEEAKGIERFHKLGLTLAQTAKLINKGTGWTLIRFNLLKMPEPIQTDAAAGFLTQSQIQDLSSIKNPDEQMNIVRQIKEAKLRGEKRLPEVKTKKKDPTKLKRRGQEEIFSMIEHILNEFKDGNIITRTLAWCNGEISDLDLYRDIKEFANDNDKKYNPPLEVQHLMRMKTYNGQ